MKFKITECEEKSKIKFKPFKIEIEVETMGELLFLWATQNQAMNDLREEIINCGSFKEECIADFNRIPPNTKEGTAGNFWKILNQLAIEYNMRKEN